ncbi:hypothetical protein RRG08_056976 [Elysia crispata]|uniref:Uncharacterized protein n=1 Tax=Elysia crispata TaxID=231223 RepID=A0AAE0Z693_9GAST|nr:hypothetical protein RRG08_056976 [Elysia crispata]
MASRPTLLSPGHSKRVRVRVAASSIGWTPSRHGAWRLPILATIHIVLTSSLASGVASSIMDILTYSRIMNPQGTYTSGWRAPASQEMGEN